MSQHSLEFHGRIAYSEQYDLVGGYQDQGKRIAEALGDKDILVLRGHGVVVVSETIERAYLDLYVLELASRTQLLALSTGQKLRPFTEDEIFELVGTGADQEEAMRHFRAMRQLVDRRSAVVG
jgi:ribulose-5-phosphate 4-epimerase/fuculose-1-phosphate aldolase